MLKLSKKQLTIKSLAADEQGFSNDLVDARGEKWKDHGQGVIPGTRKIRKSYDSYYYREETFKKRIFLHATHGPLSTDAGNLSKKNYHVSTSYLVARDGTVYELFDPKYWSYHIGSSQKRGTWSNKTISSTSIGIEMSNWLWLREHPSKPDILLDAWDFPYCMKSDLDHYKETSYRGHKYYATFTDAQYRAVDTLLLRLCRKFEIPHTFLKGKDKYKLFHDVPHVGILSHANLRPDKIDVGPVFDYGRIAGR